MPVLLSFCSVGSLQERDFAAASLLAGAGVASRSASVDKAFWSIDAALPSRTFEGAGSARCQIDEPGDDIIASLQELASTV
jgi:hypothetical protein